MRTATDTAVSDPVGLFASTDDTVPAAPGGLTAVGGDGWVDLSWDNPADSSIIEYQLREKPVGVTDWRCWRRIHSSTHVTTSYTMPGITNGLRYQVQLRALNAADASNPSQTTATPTPGP